jgi:hypothetical protein
MTQTDTFDEYVRERLENWGRVFSWRRDFEPKLGHKSKDIVSVLMTYGGAPPRVTGFKPEEVDRDAMEIEDLVRAIFEQDPRTAIVLRAFYCAPGRRGVERYDCARRLSRAYFSRSAYYLIAAAGKATVAVMLKDRARREPVRKAA